MLNACNKLRSKRSSELDDEITKKTKRSTQLDDEITAKNNKITELNTQISKAIEEKYEIKSRGDWQEPMFTGMGKYLYAVDEMISSVLMPLLTLRNPALAVVAAIMGRTSMMKNPQLSRP